MVDEGITFSEGPYARRHRYDTPKIILSS
ncbi:hypothetical protein TSAR_005922 [Trichomalopsis sarcophagae]|uniref:Uncharacterized protein n=1 Tax=Trichomalopsis sarcophagae TaxID=543379 RepID=A0A232F9Q0_9HYME|nr:hypothetical protein TSAR_005922 [Trichomalopsis sarcophagae]